MAYQETFQRYESKYLLTTDQRRILEQAMSVYMSPDHYGLTTIRNIYYDTPDHRLIRTSLEKPIYKEKLRLRSYQANSPNSPIYVEIKKKFRDIVYKRRLAMPEAEAKSWLSGESVNIPSTQIAREIDYFRSFYPQLTPHIFLAYDRTAWYCTSGSDLRITFDENIRFRTQDLQLSGNAEGHSLLAPNQVLMEIKTGGSIPLWLTQVLTQNNIFKTSYSKYGNAYLKLQKEGVNHYVR